MGSLMLLKMNYLLPLSGLSDAVIKSLIIIMLLHYHHISLSSYYTAPLETEYINDKD